MNRLALKAYTEPEGVLGQHVTQGEKVSIKRCAVGDHCSLAKYAKLSGSVLFESVVVGEGCVPLVVPGAWGNAAYRAKLENCIVAKGVRIGEHATLKDCEIGEGCVIAEGIQLKGERVALD